MIDRRFWASTQALPAPQPRASGPRWSRSSIWRSATGMSRSGWSERKPEMPHMKLLSWQPLMAGTLQIGDPAPRATSPLAGLRVGYAPLSPTLEQPGDRRRFPYYAERRRFDFEIANPI